MEKKQSLLSNLLGEESYENWIGYARIVIAVGTIILLVFGGLSVLFHSSIICYFLELVTGTSLLFIAYVAMWVLLLDIKVDVDESEEYSWEHPKKSTKSLAYKLSVIWTVVLIIFGIMAIYYSNIYRKQYAFECDTFLVDKQAYLYHLDWTECEASEHAGNLEEMLGYQIPDNYSICQECKEIAEEAEADYNADRNFRR